MTAHAQVWEVAQHLPHDEPLYQAIERAITVPCPCPCHIGPGDSHIYECFERADCTGRVLRPQPGFVMACPEIAQDPLNHEAFGAGCPTCGGSGTVPDPSEAGVMARDEACGRFRRVREALSMEEGVREPYERLLMALDEGYYPGVLAATLAAIRAIVTVEA